MDEPSRNARAVDLALCFAERWAEFTKAFAIYPPTNVRVRTALEAMLQSLEESTASVGATPENGLEICFYRGAVTFGSETRDLKPGTNLHWLHDRIHRAALAGVAFLPGLEEAPLLTFTQRLLDLYTRREVDPSFEALWPQAYPGLRLIDRHFGGSFADCEGETGERLVTWGEVGSVALDLSQDEPLVARLAEHPGIRDTLARMQRRLASVTQPGEATCEVDLLGRIVRQMPADVMDDENRILEIAEAAIKRLDEQIDDLGDHGAAALTDDVEIIQLMFEASQGLLGRADDPDNVVPELHEVLAESTDSSADESGKKGKGAPASAYKRRDEEIRDDAHAFQQDLAQMPPPVEERWTVSTVGSVAEQMGVYLHFLADPTADEMQPYAERGLEALLAGAGPGEAAVLRQYLNPAKEGEDPTWEDRHRRIVRILRRTGVPRRFRERGLLTASTAAEEFPREFGLYLDSLDPDQSAEMGELAKLALILGPRRILAAKGNLIGSETILDDARLSRLLAQPAASMLPFARILFEHGGGALQQRVLAYLRRIYPNRDVACLLYLAETPDFLPGWYLRALTDVQMDARSRASLPRRVAGHLARFVRETAGQEELIPRRLQVIRELAALMTPEVELILDEVVRARTFGLLPREPKAIRNAAREVLRLATMPREAIDVS